ncbi:hypothetical protein BJY01DRAFT_258462 [Aspergillus pseudoustus]|uniref:F-box domain-containing protein n=1 Tax=Aspergillus pseudoustus TaxID=1810923 RepID=A0ABR4JDM0_9EURO
MASGTAYRCPELAGEISTLESFRRNPFIPSGNLCKAPPNKKTRSRPWKANPLFDRLPVEILQFILLNLDLTSLGNLRCVNQTARCAVECLRAYSLLRTHASDTLRVMHSTKCSSYFALGDLFTEFCYPWCRTCLASEQKYEFAPFLYLPSLTRSCFKCNTLRDEYQPGEVGDICFRFGLKKRDINKAGLPLVHAIDRGARSHCQRPIADVTQAKALATKIHGSIEAATDIYCQRLNRHPHTRPRPRPDPTSTRYWRLSATVALPYFDRATQKTETGVYCRACTYHWEQGFAKDWKRGETILHPHPPNREAYFQAFLERDIPKHFEVCKNVKKGYDFSRKKDRRSCSRQGEDFIVGPANQV